MELKFSLKSFSGPEVDFKESAVCRDTDAKPSKARNIGSTCKQA